MARLRKYYVVWQGRVPGVYGSWAECKEQVDGHPAARYRAFGSREAAEEAFAGGYQGYLRENPSPRAAFKKIMDAKPVRPGKPFPRSLAVDAACSGNPGDMEYRGVYVATGQEIFHVGPMPKGTNNVGEFLALVHGLALLKQKDIDMPVYSDSRNAIAWVKARKCKTLLERVPENEPIFDLIARAEKWLRENPVTSPVCKWETAAWGEIPADFGRKG